MKRIITMSFPFIWVVCSAISVKAQTDQDAIMMGKQQFCTGVLAGQSQFKQYWEGTLKRENLNIGSIHTRNIGVMGNYGITGKLNVLFSLPYIQTKASAGTLKGKQGLQDLSLWVKWMPIETSIKPGLFSLYFMGGYSTPIGRYIVDYLPLSIGMGSKVFSARMMTDLQKGSYFITGSVTLHKRSNITLERNAYYTDQLTLNDQTSMPMTSSFGIRTGYRDHGWIAEALFYQNNTWGGTDIRRNDMPFPSNNMDATHLGFNIKYEFDSGLSLLAMGDRVVKGRNVGQSTAFQAGVVYIFDMSGLFQKKKEDDEKK